MGAEGQILEEIKSLDYVKEALGVFGNYDLLVKIQCPDVSKVSETIAKKIRQFERIQCTTTLMCAN